jgi:ribosomal protein S18 acetylase RimI-like enzyme
VTTFALQDAAAAAEHADGVWRLYDAVFGDFSSRETWVEELWDPHRGRDGFRLATAYDRSGEGGSLLGFGWCYVGERGQFWPDLVVSTLPREVTDAWVGGHLEVVELAVDPEARGRGVGGRLLDLMTASRGGRRGLLGTSPDDADPAVRLYRSRGWVRIGLLAEDVQVMGLAGSATNGPSGLPD